MASSFLLDWEEMSKAFLDLKAPSRLKRKPLEELERLGLAQWGVWGGAPERKWAWPLYIPREGGRVCRDDGGQCPVWEGRLWLCPVPLLDNHTEDKAGSREPLPLISTLQPCTGTPGFLGHLSPLQDYQGRPESCLCLWVTRL